MSIVDEDKGLSRVHPSNGSIEVGRVTHDVWGRSVKWGSLSKSVWEFVLVEESVWLVIASLLKKEVGGALWDTEHVSGAHGEIHTDRVSLNEMFVSSVGLW